MHTKICLILCLLFTGYLLAAQTESKQYLTIGPDGAGNILFASGKIPVGGEHLVSLKSQFVYGEPIWGRAYFPETYSSYNVTRDDQFFLELSIDGHVVQTVYQEHPEADWGQMQVWVDGTGNDYFTAFHDALNDATPGMYRMTIALGIRRFVREDSVDVSPSSKKKVKQKQYITTVLSSGSFDLIKE